MDVTLFSDAQLDSTINQAEDLQARLQREKELLALLPEARAERDRRTADAIRRTESATASAAAALAGVQMAADAWKIGLLALLQEAPTPPEVGDAVAVVFGRGVPREYKEAEGAYKLRLSEYVNSLGAILQPLRAIRDRRNLPAVKIGLTEGDCGQWWETIGASAGRWAAFF